MITKRTAGYVDGANTSEICQDCAMFRGPLSCDLVRGKILPDGTCKRWVAKPAPLAKDSPAVGDVHVSTALGNEEPSKGRKKWRRFSAIIGQGVVKPQVVVQDGGTAATMKRYGSTKDLPAPVKNKLKGKRRRQWMHVFNSELARHGDESRAFAAAWSTAQKADVLSKEPMVGVGGRKIEPYDANTFFVPLKYDPMALSWMRDDQVPRVLDALTHPKRLSKVTVPIGDLTAIKNRVSRESITKHLGTMAENAGRIDPMTSGDHIEGRDDLKPVIVAAMNGNLYLLDGHDRVVAIWLDGGDQVRARFLDADGYDDSKPDADDTHVDSAYNLLQGVDGRTLKNFYDDTLSVPFPYDNNFFIGLRPDQLPKFTFALTHQDELQDATVPLSSLVAIQNRVNADTVASKVESGWNKPPVIVRRDGVNYIGDGHDRLAAAWLKGQDSVPVKLADITWADNTMRPEGVAKSLVVDVQKLVPDKRQVFGWASVCTMKGEYVVDKQGDVIPVEALEPAVYEYVLTSRDGGDMHVERGMSRMIESMMFTKEKQDALGIDLGREGWWGGWQVDSPRLWDAVKRGDRPEFSIGGAAVSVPYEEWLEKNR